MTSLILRVAARWLTPVMAGLGVYLLLRGHLGPGGGFIGASVVALAAVFRYYAYGTAFIDRMVRLGAGTLVGVGLLIAAGTGSAGWLWGDHFFEPATLHVGVPLVGEIGLSSELLFEVAVFLTVLGIAIAVLQELGDQP